MPIKARDCNFILLFLKYDISYFRGGREKFSLAFLLYKNNHYICIRYSAGICNQRSKAICSEARIGLPQSNICGNASHVDIQRQVFETLTCKKKSQLYLWYIRQLASGNAGEAMYSKIEGTTCTFTNPDLHKPYT